MDACAQGEALPRLNPVNNNVVFCSARHKWSFTLESYARHYAAFFGAGLDARQFARRLWGNCYFNYQTRRFEGKPAAQLRAVLPGADVCEGERREA